MENSMICSTPFQPVVGLYRVRNGVVGVEEHNEAGWDVLRLAHI